MPKTGYAGYYAKTTILARRLGKVNIQAALNDVVEKLTGWGYGLILLIPNFVAALVVMLITLLVARVVHDVVAKGLSKTSSHAMLHSLLATIARVVVILIGTFIALGILKLDKTVTSLLAGAGVVGLALAFAFQDIASNFLSGILLALRRPFNPGEIIETNDYFGTVETMNLRSTQLRLPQGQLAIIPNSSVFQNPIKNYSQLGMQRIDLSCGVAYGDDLDTVENLALEAVRGLPMVEAGRPIDLYFTEFGDSSINFKVRFWVKYARQPDFLGAQSAAIKAIKKAFDKNGITIPFPIRTLDFGVVGGVNLNEVLPAQMYETNGRSAAPKGVS